MALMFGQLCNRERLRLVRFHDDEQDRDFAFLTHAFHLTSLEIANLYKNRRQIELFFYDKWNIMRSRSQICIENQTDRVETIPFNFS